MCRRLDHDFVFCPTVGAFPTPCSSHTWASKAGGRGDASPAVENQRGTSPQKLYFCSFFLDTYDNLAFYTIFKIKWPKFEEKLNFWGRWVWVPMNPSPLKQNFVATPLFSHHRRSPSAGGQICPCSHTIVVPRRQVVRFSPGEGSVQSAGWWMRIIRSRPGPERGQPRSCPGPGPDPSRSIRSRSHGPRHGLRHDRRHGRRHARRRRPRHSSSGSQYRRHLLGTATRSLFVCLLVFKGVSTSSSLRDDIGVH